MAGNLSALIIVLLGAGCVTTGLLLILSNRALRRRAAGTNRLESHLLPAALLSLGAGLLFMGWYLEPAEDALPPDLDALLNGAPTAAGALPATRIDATSVLLLVWGTPSDNDKASEQAEQAYSYAVGKALSERLRKGNPEMKVDNLLLTREQQTKILYSPDETRTWCTGGQWQVLALVDISATHHSERGYVPWREPNYLFRDCLKDRQIQIQGRVTERPADTFPYQQALEREFTQALARFSSFRG